MWRAGSNSRHGLARSTSHRPPSADSVAIGTVSTRDVVAVRPGPPGFAAVETSSGMRGYAPADAFPVIWLALSSDTFSPLQLSEMANRIVKPVLQTAPGAADVTVFGERKFSMRVWIDPDKLAAYGIPHTKVVEAIQKSNQEAGGSVLELGEAEYVVRASGYLQSLDDFRKVPLVSTDGHWWWDGYAWTPAPALAAAD